VSKWVREKEGGREGGMGKMYRGRGNQRWGGMEEREDVDVGRDRGCGGEGMRRGRDRTTREREDRVRREGERVREGI